MKNRPNPGDNARPTGPATAPGVPVPVLGSAFGQHGTEPANAGVDC